MESLIGRTVGRYRILAELGRGGMGVVYRALDTTLDREVALKVLPPDVVADDDRRRRFLREAQTASRLEHAHIGVIHEVGEADGVSFIAMELVRGEPLSQAIARGSLGTSRSLELATEIAEGLARAHEQGIVHRDLKPANVMLTDDGHAKIIDFGLAKSLGAGAPSSDAATIAASTDIGVIKGTAAYMSPEQARGERLDARSDLFSFGVMLYQMLSGRQPFQAPSYVDTLHRISHDDAPPLSWTGTAPAADAQQDIERLLEKCLAKDPAARYQTARDLVVDLRAVRRRLDAGTSRVSAAMPAPADQARRRPSWILVAGGVAVAIALIATGFGIYRTMRPAASPPPPLAPSGKPSVAVLYFQNSTGSPQLDWLRTGLTNMVVTDLSQSPDMDVLGTDRLYQILASLKLQSDAVLTFDTVREVARLGGVQHVLTGDYVKAGDTIRINITLRDAATGRVLTADHLEANGEANLFPTVDDLTRRVHTHLAGSTASPTPVFAAPGARGAPGSGLYHDLQDVTTSSIDAYRAYAEGVRFLESGRPGEAEPRLLEAIRIDPDFALAMARLAAVENNLRRPDKRSEYAKAALDRSDRLSIRDRYYLEGFYYANNEETVERGIEAYRKLLALSPDHYTAKHNLANAYSGTEQHAEAARLGEELRRSAFVAQVSLNNLAMQYADLDRYDQAMAVAAESEKRFPNTSRAARLRGDVAAMFGRIDESQAAYASAASLDPRDPTIQTDQVVLALVQHRWSEAAALLDKLSGVTDPFVTFAVTEARIAFDLYRGRTADALRAIEAATKRPGPWGATFDSELHVVAARTYLILGRPAQALPHAEAARQHPGDLLLTPGSFGRLYAAIALNRLGRTADAKAAAGELAARALVVEGPRLKRFSSLLTGTVALDRHDIVAATSSLVEAEGLLSARSSYGPPPSQPEVWFALGSAYLAAGNDGEAEKRFALMTSRIERALFPIEYVRSLYALGQIADRRGDRARAREYYSTFVELWGDGDIDRDHVAEAKKKLAMK